MSISSTALKQQILDEIGAELPDVKPHLDKIVPNIDSIWDMWGSKAYSDPPLQYFYARKTALDRIIGQFRNLCNQNLGVLNPNLGQKVDRMANVLRRNFQEDIEFHEDQYAKSHGGVIGTIKRTAIRTPDDVGGGNDPNDPRYRGDAMTRS